MNKKIVNFDVENFFPYKIHMLADMISKELSVIYTKEFGITIPEWRTLVWVGSNKTVRATDICFRCRMDKTQVSRVVSGLESRGLLKRQPDKEDHRCYQLKLTQQGEQLIETIIPKAQAWEKELLASLSSDQSQQLLDTLTILETQIDKSHY